MAIEFNAPDDLFDNIREVLLVKIKIVKVLHGVHWKKDKVKATITNGKEQITITVTIEALHNIFSSEIKKGEVIIPNTKQKMKLSMILSHIEEIKDIRRLMRFSPNKY